MIIPILIGLLSIIITTNILSFNILTILFIIIFILSFILLYYYNYLINSGFIIINRPVDMKNMPTRVDHDRRRMLTYPHSPLANSWYHLCDSKELDNGRVVEIRALGLTLAVWRDSNGKPVVHDAFCLHLGANLAVGGKVVDGCIECPFHKWRFGNDGSIRLIPYAKNPEQCPKSPKLKVYPAVDWCGLVCMYYHADGPETTPEFQLPDWVPNQIEKEGWTPFSKLDLGHLNLTPIDWVDQAGDHAHFHTLHNEFLIPYTTIPFPDWIKNLIPLAICHQLVTYKGDDPDWETKMKEMGMGSTDKHLIFFTDKAGLTWNGKVLETTLSETLENYIGPSIIAFHIPFTIGAFKIVLSVTPVEGGSIMRARTWVDARTRFNPFKRLIAWLLIGISASQLASDISILENKIRLKKPLLVPYDGPYNRTNAWLKQFYSEKSIAVGDTHGAYQNDW